MIVEHLSDPAQRRELVHLVSPHAGGRRNFGIAFSDYELFVLETDYQRGELIYRQMREGARQLADSCPDWAQFQTGGVYVSGDGTVPLPSYVPGAYMNRPYSPYSFSGTFETATGRTPTPPKPAPAPPKPEPKRPVCRAPARKIVLT
jgi:hypothetical protein